MFLSTGWALSAVDVFCPDTLTAIYDGKEHAAMGGGDRIVKIHGARNGAFCGTAVISSTDAIQGHEAKVSDLRQKTGNIAIPASCIEIRYALPTGANGLAKLPPGVAPFDALSLRPRETGTVHPVWIIVNVPENAAPGEYEGRIDIAGQSIPVTMTVADWVLPKSRDFVTWVDFIQSPETIATSYGKRLWSDAHWELIGRSFDQLARVGNKTIYIPLMCKTHFGNAESMVRWIKTGERPATHPAEVDANTKEYLATVGGFAKTVPEFKHDFSIAEKYLDICIKHAGKPSAVIFYIYEGALGGSQGNKPEECMRGVPFTLINQVTGATIMTNGPCHNNSNIEYPNYPDDTIAFWKPVIDGMRERLKARGIGDSAINLGISNDLPPGKKQMEYLARTFPYAWWCTQGHGLSKRQGGYSTTVWNARFPRSASDRLYGWRGRTDAGKEQIVATFDRDIWKPDFATQLVKSRLLGEWNIAGQQKGFGRMSADFWPVHETKWGKASLVNRYPASNWAQLTLRMTPYLYPGPEGALSTIRFELLREGVQECEARIFLEKALLDKSASDRIGSDLAKKVQDLLDERIGVITSTIKKDPGGWRGLDEATGAFARSDWQGRSGRLFALAGEVSKVCTSTR